MDSENKVGFFWFYLLRNRSVTRHANFSPKELWREAMRDATILLHRRLWPLVGVWIIQICPVHLSYMYVSTGYFIVAYWAPVLWLEARQEVTLFRCKPSCFSHANDHVDGLVSMGITCLASGELLWIFPPVAATLENEKTLGTRLFLRMSSWSGYPVVIFHQLNKKQIKIRQHRAKARPTLLFFVS